jgi:hypothetical protein
VRDEVIAHFSSRGDTWAIVNLIRELDQMQTEFGSTFHYEHALAQNIIPVMKQTIRALFLQGTSVVVALTITITCADVT